MVGKGKITFLRVALAVNDNVRKSKTNTCSSAKYILGTNMRVQKSKNHSSRRKCKKYIQLLLKASPPFRLGWYYLRSSYENQYTLRSIITKSILILYWLTILNCCLRMCLTHFNTLNLQV